MEEFFTELSLNRKPLQTNELLTTLAPGGWVESIQERVRERLREEMQKRHLSQREISDLLGGAANGWSQSRIAKLMTGRVQMGVDDLAALCFALGLTTTEAIRDRGMEFCAEMTPSELRMIERIRQLPAQARSAFMTLLDVRSHTDVEARGATKPRERLTKGRRS